MKERLLLWLSIALIVVGVVGFFAVLFGVEIAQPTSIEFDPETGLAMPNLS